MSSRIDECKGRCTDLIGKLDRRVQFDIHVRVKGTQDDLKSCILLFSPCHLILTLTLNFKGIKLRDGCLLQTAHLITTQPERSISQRRDPGSLRAARLCNGRNSRDPFSGSMVVVSLCLQSSHHLLMCLLSSGLWKNCVMVSYYI